ncbi:MAG: type II secretion system protein GspL [Pseudomonadota bacterium]
MPETLVLRIPDHPSDQPSWLVVDDAGTRIGDITHGTLADASTAAHLRKVCVLLPANDSLVGHSSLPLKSTQKLLQALPFSFEDHLISGTDELHFGAGKRDDDGRFAVAAVGRSLLDTLLDKLEGHNLTPNIVIPLDAALPLTEDGCTVLVEAREATLRTADGDAVNIALDSVVDALGLAEVQRDDESPMPITVYLDDAGSDHSDGAINAIHEAFEHAEFRRLPHGALTKLAGEAQSPAMPNLLQGDYAPSTSYEKMLSPWKPAAIAAGLFMALTVGFKAMELSAMKSRLSELNAAMQTLAKETYPNRQRFPDPPGMFRAEMRDTGNASVTGGSEFLQYIHTVATVSQDVSGLDVRRMSFRPGNLDLEVVAPSLQLLDGFATQIASNDAIDASLNSTKANGSTVQGRVQLKRGQP